jgi:hypothetical protein
MPDHQPVDLLGQRLDALFQRIALIGKGKIGTGFAARLGDAPGDRPVIGDPHDQSALAAHETRGVNHVVLRSAGNWPAATYGIGYPDHQAGRFGAEKQGLTE